MRAWVMRGPHRGSVDEVPEPGSGDYDAVVEILVCGVCSSTDKMLRLGTFAPGVTFPSILGHESVGRVVQIGTKVRSMKPGDLVTRPGAYRSDLQPLKQYWGGFAERGVVTDWDALKADRPGAVTGARDDHVILPADANPRLAALAISLSETYSVAARHDLLGKTVAVIGTGIAGLSFTRFAKLFGAATVLTVGRREERLAVAIDLGADIVALASDAAATAAALGGVDIVFEASGQASMTAEVYRWVRAGGSLVVHSAPDQPASIDLFTGPRDVALTVASPREAAVLPQVLALVESGVINSTVFLSHRYGFDSMGRAFDDIDRGNVVKALVDFA